MKRNIIKTYFFDPKTHMNIPDFSGIFPIYPRFGDAYSFLYSAPELIRGARVDISKKVKHPHN